MPSSNEKAEAIGLPPRVFLYTLDQISVLISVSLETIKTSYIYYEGRSIGSKDRFLIQARNIAPADVKPDWRVSERELIRWFKVMGYKYYERGNIQ